MRFIHLIKKKLLLAVAALFAVTGALAQTTAPAPTTTSGYNQLATLLVVMTIVLAFVIWGLGQVLIVLSRQAMEKSKKVSTPLTVILAIVFMLATQVASAQTTAVTDAVKELPNYGGLSATNFYMFVVVIATEVIAVLFLAFSIRRIYTELMPQKEVTAPVKKAMLKEWWARLDQKLFTKAIPLEREADHLLDHNYDGIQELDNALPPWWKYGFYITILVAVVYLLNFHVLGNGKNPTEEYAAEMEDARIQKEIFEATNKDRIDENNVPMADAAGLATAKEIFLAKCWACHGKLGEGGAGPNLTDDFWLHKGSLNDIFHTIKNGYADKGMQSWSNDFTPKEISFLASYVKTLHGTNPPNPKAPQGDLYAEAATADSARAAIKPDSTSAKNFIARSNKKDSTKASIKK